MPYCNNLDLLISDEKIEKHISNIEKTQDSLIELSSKITALQNSIEKSVVWIGNGKEECSMFLQLLSKFSAYIAGVDTNAGSGASESALASKTVAGEDDHITNLDNSISEFRELSLTYEKGGTASCIKMLDEIQGD